MLNIVFSAYERFYPDEKHDKIKKLHIATLDKKKQYADLDFQLEPYAVDCGLGRSKISYITNDKVSELLPKQGYIKKVDCKCKLNKIYQATISVEYTLSRKVSNSSSGL